MTIWFAALACIIPLCLSKARARTFLALAATSGIAALMPAPEPVGYLMLDLIAGWIVLCRPAGTAQKSIGFIFALMAIFDIAYMLTTRADNGELFADMLNAFGWAQFCILAGWGAYDFGKAVSGYCRIDRGSRATGPSA